MKPKPFLREYINNNIKLILITIVVLLIPIVFVEQYIQIIYRQDSAVLNGFIYFIFYLLVPILSIGIAAFNLVRCFTGRAKKIHQKLFNIALTYLILIVSFTNLFYMEVCVGDFSDALSKYYKYNYLNYSFSENNKNKFITANYKFKSERAFNGMHYRLWTGVDYKIYENKNPQEIEFTEDIINNANITDYKNIIKFIPGNRIRVYLECMYFSIISIATVGFGDISPNLWYSELTVMIEVVLGQILIVVVVGFMFSNGSGNLKG